MAIKNLKILNMLNTDYDDSIPSAAIITDGKVQVSNTPTVSADVLRKADIPTLIAPADAPYVVVTLNGDLSAERRLQVGAILSLTDGGANGDITVGLDSKDEDDMVSDSAVHVPTQQSVKAYVDGKTFDSDICLSFYDAEPARVSVSNVHGGLNALATAQPLNSVPTNIVVSKGTGKIVIIVNAGSDLVGDILVTGTSVNRNTGATTPADTDTITVDAVTTDNSDTDSNGNTRPQFVGAYISSKWFQGSVTLSTTNLTLTDVDVYHVSFEQFNDQPNLVLDTFDSTILVTNVNAEYDAYLYCIQVTGDKCDIALEAELHVGVDGETPVAGTNPRLRRGNLGVALDGTTDGIFVELYYSNSPAYVEDVNMKVWATVTKTLN